MAALAWDVGYHRLALEHARVEVRDIPVLIALHTEVRAVKLFANTCLAARASLFDWPDTSA